MLEGGWWHGVQRLALSTHSKKALGCGGRLGHKKMLCFNNPGQQYPPASRGQCHLSSSSAVLFLYSSHLHLLIMTHMLKHIVFNMSWGGKNYQYLLLMYIDP